MSKFKQYRSAVAYLEDIAATPHDHQYMQSGAKNPSVFLKRTRYLLKLLGNPHERFKYAHISGTSGKGSTVAYLHSILCEAGHKVGSFTSPYCTTSIEKIKVNCKLIDPLVFAQLTERLKPIINRMDKTCRYGRPSYFEIFLALSMLYFKKTRCDWVILEVGCGGSFDATNVIKKSISAITNIGLDHTRILGKTLTKIAKDKAGIIKPRTHFFTSERREKILKIFKAICKQKHAKFHRIDEGAACGFSSALRAINSKHQQENASLACAIAARIGIKRDAIESAVAKTRLPPCRFEIMQKPAKGWSASGRKPLIIILDGAHNPYKMKTVVNNLKNLTYGKLYTIFSASNTKDARTMLKILLPRVDEVVFTEFKTANRSSYQPEQLSTFAKEFKNQSIEHNSLKALKQTVKKLKPNDALLITGSLYLTGELRKHWISEDTILRKRKT